MERMAPSVVLLPQERAEHKQPVALVERVQQVAALVQLVHNSQVVQVAQVKPLQVVLVLVAGAVGGAAAVVVVATIATSKALVGLEEVATSILRLVVMSLLLHWDCLRKLIHCGTVFGGYLAQQVPMVDKVKSSFVLEHDHVPEDQPDNTSR